MIIYIGNKLLKTRKTKAVIDTLSELLSEIIEVKSYSTFQNPIFKMIDGIYHLILYRKKANLVLIDVFSSANFYYSCLLGLICRLLKLKYALFLHGGNLPQRQQRSTKLVHTLFSKSSKIITPSHYLFDYFEPIFSNVIIIPNVLNVKNYSFAPNRVYESPTILYLRGFGAIYNPQMIIEALPLIILHYPNTKLYMLGHDIDGTMEECKNLATKLNVSKHIEFKGKLLSEEWIRLSEQCNLMVSTPNFDNTPISVLEGMLLGLPVISTNVGGIKYIIEDNRTGYLVSKGNAKQLSEAILNIFNHSPETEKTTISARRFAEQFDWENIKIKWIALFKELNITTNKNLTNN